MIVSVGEPTRLPLVSVLQQAATVDTGSVDSVAERMIVSVGEPTQLPLVSVLQQAAADDTG